MAYIFGGGSGGGPPDGQPLDDDHVWVGVGGAAVALPAWMQQEGRWPGGYAWTTAVGSTAIDGVPITTINLFSWVGSEIATGFGVGLAFYGTPGWLKHDPNCTFNDLRGYEVQVIPSATVGGSTANIRYSFGVQRDTAAAYTAGLLPAEQCIQFLVDAARYGDLEIYGVTKTTTATDGTNATEVATGVVIPATADEPISFAWDRPDANTVDFYINRVLRGTSTTNIPTTGTAVTAFALSWNAVAGTSGMIFLNQRYVFRGV